MTGRLDQLRADMQAGESETLEFKRSTGEQRAAMHALTAMLNHRGGRVIFGVEDDRRITGQHVGDRTLEDLAQEIGQIEPPVFPAVERAAIGDGRELIVVSVPQGAGRPYSHRGVAYRRVGNVNARMSRDEYNRMLLERLHGEQRWENESAPGWTVDDLDGEELIRTLEEAIRRGRLEDPGTREPSALLRGLGLMRDGVMLRAAPVLFGRQEVLEARMPQCLLRVARFRGTDRTEFIDNRQFHGNVFRLLQLAERFLRESLPVAGRVLPGLFERVDDPLYPLLALREALANAFCHRDYSIGGGSVAVAIYDDRLEVTSSGTLHFGLTPDALLAPHESLPWNPLIARVLFRRGVIEQWGRGTLKIVELMMQAGLPRPTIQDAGGCVTVRFAPARYVPPQRVAHDLSERQRAVLALLEASRGGLARREIKALMAGQATEWEVKGDLLLLRQLGLAEPVGWGRGAVWRFLQK
ncbi:MAG: putative DNA binding domain-containing protein [Chloroflexi bacterium]|nr:putative DNA binding domain-containing protein [Chloroflexota bacterium]